MHVFEVLATGPKPDIEDAWNTLAWMEPSPVSAVDHQEISHNLWQLRAYAETRVAAEAAKTLIIQCRATLEPYIRAIPEQDWVAKSLEGLPTIYAGRLAVIGAHNRHTVIGGRIPIEIEAGAAFGTGHHGTTRGSLLLLQKAIKHRRPQSLLDLGTGTGVLAIAAHKLGTPYIVATDKDAQAVQIAKENALKNNCINIHFAQATGTHKKQIQDPAPYDLICANIIAPVLKKLAQHLPTLLSPDGVLIISGLLHHQTASTRHHYTQRGLVPIAQYRLDGWHSIIFQTSSKHTRQRPQIV